MPRTHATQARAIKMLLVHILSTLDDATARRFSIGVLCAVRHAEACGGGKGGGGEDDAGSVGGAACGRAPNNEGRRVVQEVFGGRCALPPLPTNLCLLPAQVAAWHKGTCSAAVAAGERRSGRVGRERDAEGGRGERERATVHARSTARVGDALCVRACALCKRVQTCNTSRARHTRTYIHVHAYTCA
jgi:hypothetical protein